MIKTDKTGPATQPILIKLKVYHLLFVLSWKSQCNICNVPTITRDRNLSILSVSNFVRQKHSTYITCWRIHVCFVLAKDSSGVLSW